MARFHREHYSAQRNARVSTLSAQPNTASNPRCVRSAPTAAIRCSAIALPHGQSVQSAPESKAKGRRVAASSFVLTAAILLAVAMVVPWWGIAFTDGGADGVGELPTRVLLFGLGNLQGGYVLEFGHLSRRRTYRPSESSRGGLGLGLTAAIAAFAGMALGFAVRGTLRRGAPLGLRTA